MRNEMFNLAKVSWLASGSNELKHNELFWGGFFFQPSHKHISSDNAGHVQNQPNSWQWLLQSKVQQYATNGQNELTNLSPTLLPWCMNWATIFPRWINKVTNISKQKMAWSHQKPPDSAQQVPSTAKCWQGLAAGVGALPSGLWHRSDSGTPFTLEEDPPCGEICGSAQELLISDGNHKEEPYRIAAKLKKNPLKTLMQIQFTFLLPS